MTPMSNADYLIRLQHADDLDALKEAKKAAGLSYQELAEKIGVNKVWLASLTAEKIVDILDSASTAKKPNG